MKASLVQREREFKSFHISDGIFIYIFILIWLRDLPGIAIHAPSEDIGRLWTGRKKRGLLSIVRHQCVCQERKAWHARNPASGKPPKDCLPIHPCCSEETAPLFTKVPSFCSYKFFKCIFLEKRGKHNNQMSDLMPDSWSGDKGENQGQVWFCSKIKSKCCRVVLESEIKRRNTGWHLPILRVTFLALFLCLLC